MRSPPAKTDKEQLEAARNELLNAAIRWREYDRRDGWSIRSLLNTVDRLAVAVDRYEELNKPPRRI